MKPTLSRILAASALALAACLAAAAPGALAAQRVVEFPLPADHAAPNAITTGPDGALWAPDGSLGVVWRITPAGKIRSFEVGGLPTSIASAHGALWITDGDRDQIIRLTPDGATTSYKLPTAGAFPIGIVEGPDGALWFTEGRSDKIGRLALDGSITEYAIPTAGAFARDIAVGPDGALWFTEQSADKVGRITTAGEVTEFPLAPGTLPGAIVGGPDGALWFAQRNLNSIARITTDGTITDEFPLKTADADPSALEVGPDGALWIAQRSADSIARMTPDGAVTREIRVRGGGPDDLATGPDGRLWFPQGNPGQVGRLDIGFDPPVTAEGVTFKAPAFTPVTRTVATFRDADPNAQPGDYTATIAWGDGTRSAGTVQRTADGGFAVRGHHTYLVTGTRKVTVRITDGIGNGLDARAEGWAIVT